MNGTKKLLSVFSNQENGNSFNKAPPPIWLMRQAGRYLPEYRKVRSLPKNFLELCYTPEFAEEVTLQPIRRYGFDAAIMFSDILVIPDALGCKVEFIEGDGPRLNPITTHKEIEALRDKLKNIEPHLAPVFQLIRQLSKSLPKETSLIGFSGSPWTLACYMLCGGSRANFPKARLIAYQEPELLDKLIDILSDAIAHYLILQVKAGVEVIQLFDSWAGLLDQKAFDDFVTKPTKKIIDTLRLAGITIPIIGFPRGAGNLYQSFAMHTGVNGLSLDPSVNLTYARNELKPLAVLQGNLEPLRLQGPEKLWQQQVNLILDNLGNDRFIFNLGHGIDKETDPEVVKALVEYIRAYNYQNPRNGI